MKLLGWRRRRRDAQPIICGRCIPNPRPDATHLVYFTPRGFIGQLRGYRKREYLCQKCLALAKTKAERRQTP